MAGRTCHHLAANRAAERAAVKAIAIARLGDGTCSVIGNAQESDTVLGMDCVSMTDDSTVLVKGVSRSLKLNVSDASTAYNECEESVFHDAAEAEVGTAAIEEPPPLPNVESVASQLDQLTQLKAVLAPGEYCLLLQECYNGATLKEAERRARLTFGSPFG